MGSRAGGWWYMDVWGGGSHLHGATGVGAHTVSALWEGGGGSGALPAPAIAEHGGHGGSRTPGNQGPPQGTSPGQGVPVWDTSGDTHAVAFLPFATGGARQATLTLPTLQESGGAGDEMGHGSPLVHVCPQQGPWLPGRDAPGTAECLCGHIPAGSGLHVSWGVTNLPLDRGDRA